MLNIIKKNGDILISHKKVGRMTIWTTNTNKEYKSGELGKIEIYCSLCNKEQTINFRTGLLKKKYICMSCNNKGENNPFYGKEHTAKQKENHSKYMKGRFVGKNNPFYGKEHTTETKKKISTAMARRFVGENNHFYGKTHTAEARAVMSKWHKENTDIEHMRNMGIASTKKQAKGRKTLPEKLVEDKLIDLNFKFKYNKIITKVGQFDFIINDDILLEVNGDYWHANPLFYGPGKRALNERQIYKIKRDKEKNEAVIKLGYKIYYIWEHDIKQGNFEVLHEINRNNNS